jgi:hypothetical protein
MVENLRNTTALTPTGGALPAELLDESAADTGRGVSAKAEDQLIPLIYILQATSPMCDKRGPDYRDGAEPGYFYLRGAIDPIREGDIGIVAIPCEMQRVALEFLPDRQGLVNRHAQMPADVKASTEEESGKRKRVLVRANGNVIQDTREFAVLVDGRPYILPCWGTRHTFAREWQSWFHQFKHPTTGKVMASFSRKYRLTTVPESNALGRWWGLKFTDLGWVSKDEYDAARALNAIVASGAHRVEIDAVARQDTA